MCSHGFRSPRAVTGSWLWSDSFPVRHRLLIMHPHVSRRVTWTQREQGISEAAFHTDCNQTLGHSIPYEPERSGSIPNFKGVVTGDGLQYLLSSFRQTSVLGPVWDFSSSGIPEELFPYASWVYPALSPFLN